MEPDKARGLDTEAILLSIGDGVIEIDREGKVNVMNRAAERLTGFTAREILGKHYREALRFGTEKSDETRFDFIEDTLREGSENMFPKEFVVFTKKGRKVPITGSAAPVRDETGKPLGVVVAFRDITNERELENIKVEFLSLASHQLRTPLSGIKWLIETLLAEKIGTLNQAQKEYLTHIYQSNERMIKLVHDLLSVIRLEGEKPALTVTNFSLGEFLGECYEFSRLAAEKAGLAFRYETPDEAVLITSDRTLLKAILDVLISNAINYSKPGGTILFQAVREGEFVEFSVADNGIGIPREERNNLFSKFYRAPNAKAMKPEGSGLGLYTAKFLAGMLGGVIRVESIENQGSTFRLTAPVRQNPLPAGVATEVRQTPTP
ncbi:MAG: ATP-binding protein [Patescibacteria group bacterium]